MADHTGQAKDIIIATYVSLLNGHYTVTKDVIRYNSVPRYKMLIRSHIHIQRLVFIISMLALSVVLLYTRCTEILLSTKLYTKALPRKTLDERLIRMV